MLFRSAIDKAADKGDLGEAQALQWGKDFDKSAPQVAAKLARSADARARRAAQAATVKDEQTHDLAWWNHDYLAEAAGGFSPADMAKAGRRAFSTALRSGKPEEVQRVLEHVARSGAPVQGLQTILSDNIDPSNPEQATRYVKMYDYMAGVSPHRAEIGRAHV